MIIALAGLGGILNGTYLHRCIFSSKSTDKVEGEGGQRRDGPLLGRFGQGMGIIHERERAENIRY